MQCLAVLQVLTDTTSGGIYLAPTPDVNYIFRIYYNAMQTDRLSGNQYNNLYKSIICHKDLIICLFGRSIWILKRSNGYVDIV